MKNRIKKVILKIASNSNVEGIESLIINELANECSVSKFSVLRWLRNDSQPASTKYSSILDVLHRHDTELVLGDLFESSTVKASVNKRVNTIVKLVK